MKSDILNSFHSKRWIVGNQAVVSIFLARIAIARERTAKELQAKVLA